MSNTNLNVCRNQWTRCINACVDRPVVCQWQWSYLLRLIWISGSWFWKAFTKETQFRRDMAIRVCHISPQNEISENWAKEKCIINGIPSRLSAAFISGGMGGGRNMKPMRTTDGALFHIAATRSFIVNMAPDVMRDNSLQIWFSDRKLISRHM